MAIPRANGLLLGRHAALLLFLVAFSVSLQYTRGFAVCAFLHVADGRYPQPTSTAFGALFQSSLSIPPVVRGRDGGPSYVAERGDDSIRERTISEDRKSEKRQLHGQSTIPMLLSFAKRESLEGAAMAEEILIGLLREGGASDRLTVRHFIIVMDAWGKVGRPDKAEDILRRLEIMASTNPLLSPNRVVFGVLLNAHVRVGNFERAFDILNRMERSEPMAQPNTVDYNVVLTAYGRNGQVDEAERLLKRMVDRCRFMDAERNHEVMTKSTVRSKIGTTVSCRPDLSSYNALLDAYSKSYRRDAAERAEAILAKLKEESDESGGDGGGRTLRPDARTYSAAMLAVSRGRGGNGDGDDDVVVVDYYDAASAANRAEELYEEAIASGLGSDIELLQSTRLDVYAAVAAMAVASSSASSDAPAWCGQRAEEILEEMEAAGMANDIAYNKVLKVWKTTNAVDASKKAEAILKRMEERRLASRISYTTVIGALASRGDRESARRAHEILDHMRRNYEQNGNVSSKPNTQTLNSVLYAWVRCGDIERAEGLLREMETYQEAGECDMGPTVVSYSTVMDGWVKSRDKNYLANTEAVFERMCAAYRAGNVLAQPNQFSYVTLINAYVKSKQADSAQKAETALLKMYDEYVNGRTDLKPNTQTISLVIDAWQKSGTVNAGEKAEALLNWTITMYIETKDEEFRPNEYGFCSTISAWGKSRRIGKAIRAYSILKKMIELYEDGIISSPPNGHCYTAVINACAYSENDPLEKRDSLKIAIATYKELLTSKSSSSTSTVSYGRPNEVTYTTLLTALRNLLPKGKDRSSAAMTVFKSSINDGYVDDNQIRRMQSIMTPNELHDHFPAIVSPDGVIKVDALPNEWTRNVRKNGRSQSATADLCT